MPIKLVDFDSVNINPDIVKIDVQGHELSVIQGMKRTIEKCQPIFFIERSPADVAIMQHLMIYGYEFFVAGKSNNLVPYFKPSPMVNLFCVPNARIKDGSVIL